jgi:hypothetical protein
LHPTSLDSDQRRGLTPYQTQLVKLPGYIAPSNSCLSNPEHTNKFPMLDYSWQFSLQASVGHKGHNDSSVGLSPVHQRQQLSQWAALHQPAADSSIGSVCAGLSNINMLRFGNTRQLLPAADLSAEWICLSLSKGWLYGNSRDVSLYF